VVAARGRKKAAHATFVVHRQDHGDVRQVRTAARRIVGHEHVAWREPGVCGEHGLD